MRRALAAVLALLLTGAPAVASACALACPAPATASTVVTVSVAADMPADCAAMHHAGGAMPAAEARTALHPSAAPAPMAACCAMTAAPADLPSASLDRVAAATLLDLPVDTRVVRLALPGVATRGPAPPPGVPLDRARRTDILRL